MPVVYKIHPGIGFSRLGDSTDAFFIGRETVGGRAIELTAAGEVPLSKFKDADHRIKRQGARFRIFAYDQQPDGSMNNAREITADDAEIVWTVHMVNRKAAWTSTVSMAPPRNPAVTGAARSGLVIDPGQKSVSGKSAGPTKLSGGKFTLPAGSTNVDLGELRTDSAGRLIVLGGSGRSESIPLHLPVGGANFADNPGWFDDVGDGPVTATVKVGAAAAVAAVPAWVIVAPPDFAPDVSSVVTLFDRAMQVAVDAFGFPEPTRPSFRDHIQPILARTVSLRWTNNNVFWDSINEDWGELSHGTSSTTLQERKDIAEALSGPLPLQDRFNAGGGGGDNVTISKVQTRILRAWALGNFIDDWDVPKANIVTPLDYDIGPLHFTVGGGFFPGIEAGFRFNDATKYSEPFRLRSTLDPGHFTEQMALPWQSDFYQCRDSGAPWWPAQRPDVVHLATNPNTSQPWVAGIITKPEGAGAEQQMVDRFAKLGFVRTEKLANGITVQVEDERHPDFPRAGA